MSKLTLRQKRTFDELKKAIGCGEIVDMKTLMIRGGFSANTAKNPEVNLLSKKAWIDIVEAIDYDKHVKQVDELADITKNSDKDNALKAKDMLFKIGDKYPKGETKIVGIFNKIESIQGE